MCCRESGLAAHVQSRDGRLRIGDQVPDFTAKTTKGNLKFHKWMSGKSVILFNAPAGFSAVATTELVQFALAYEAFKERGFHIICVSPGSVESHTKWERDVKALLDNQVQVKFPIAADPNKEICTKLGLIDRVSKESRSRNSLSLSGLFIIDEEKQIRFTDVYPSTIGRGIYELLRVCEALVLAKSQQVATPASWPDNHANLVLGGMNMEGSVFIDPTWTDQEAARRFPNMVQLDVPSGLHYIRLTHVNRDIKPPSCFAALWQCCAQAFNCCGFGVSEAEKEWINQRPARYSTPSSARLLPLTSEAERTRFRLGGSVPDHFSPRASRCLRVGDMVPDFECESTKGKIKFHEWIEGKWVIICSHPADFTPVCTTEVGTLALLYQTFASKGFKVCSISCDSVSSHLRWEKDVIAHFPGMARIKFPLLADPDGDVSGKLGMLDQTLKSEWRTSAQCLQTQRSVQIIGDDKRLKLEVTYPAFVGRDIHDMVRIADALQLSEREGCATPACWPNNDKDRVVEGHSLSGAVIVHPDLSSTDAKKMFPDRVMLPMPSGREYMTMSRINTRGRFPMCEDCRILGANRSL